MPLTNRVPDTLVNVREKFEICDDFLYYSDTDLWTKLAADTNATVAHEGDGSRSRVKLFTGDAIKNNEAAFATTVEQFKFIANKEIVIEAKIQFAESATDDAKVAVGMGDAIGANLITDAGAVAVTDGLLLWKNTDETQWRFHTEINGTSTQTLSTTTAGGSSAQTLRIVCKPRSSTVFECRPYVDGVHLVDSNNVPIMHTVTLGTATDMDFGAYVKSGSGTSGQETLYVDYLYASQQK